MYFSINNFKIKIILSIQIIHIINLNDLELLAFI